VAAPLPGEVFGGGAIADASLETLHRWAIPVQELAFVFLAEGARALRAAGGSWGTLVQITNGLSRRPEPDKGLFAAGHAAVRALVQTAAQELRPEGIRACLLVVDGPIDSSKTAQRMVEDGVQALASADQAEVAEAAAYLATRGPRGLSYELTVTAAGRAWLP
jgi:NAD(P)-dependent dehydrogenase (short-subunit alcohol dehydrogenase family)